MQNLFSKKKVKLTYAGSVIQTVYQMSLRYLLSADCLELEPNPKTYSTLGYILFSEHSLITPFYHNICLVSTLKNR